MTTRNQSAYAFVPYVIWQDCCGLRHVHFSIFACKSQSEALSSESSIRRIMERPGITIIDSGIKEVVVQFEQRV